MRGLADAFFYAGARGLLVSNWSTNSQATVLLSVGLVDAVEANPKLSLAEAHRLSALSIIGDGKNAYQHPEFWAPFTVVGGGGPR